MSEKPAMTIERGFQSPSRISEKAPLRTSWPQALTNSLGPRFSIRAPESGHIGDQSTSRFGSKRGSSSWQRSE